MKQDKYVKEVILLLDSKKTEPMEKRIKFLKKMIRFEALDTLLKIK